MPIRVLFVCLGNICRSPLAEGVFRHQVRDAGLESEFVIDSAGTSGYHIGDAPDPRSSKVALQRGIRLAGQSRRIERRDLDTFDYVIVMDRENQKAVQRLVSGAGNARDGGAAEVRLLREFDEDAEEVDVPDPYYGGERGFETVHDIVERGCAGLLEHIRAERGL